jgi:phage virion morphogenesis protein
MTGVAVKVLAADALARLQGMEERGNNLTGLFRAFGNYMKGSIQRNFDAEGRPTKWQPLAPATLGSWMAGKKSFWNKAKKDGSRSLSKRGHSALAGRKVLTDSTDLRNSVAPVSITPRGLIIGTNVVYAAIHQFGGQAGRGRKVTIPRRPYMLFQDEDVECFNRMLLEYILTRRII